MMKTILFCAIATILSAVGPAAQAWAAQCPGSFPSPNAVGARIFTTGAGSVSATFCDGAAGYTSNMYLDDPGGIYIATGHVTPSGDTVDLGVFQVGQELVFSIGVQDSNQYYFSGPGSWNPDGVPHATVTYLGEGTYHVGFEDLYGGGDGDYDDINLIIEGPLTTGLLPPVSCASDLMLAIHDQTKGSQFYSPLGLDHQDYFYTEYGNRAALNPTLGTDLIHMKMAALIEQAEHQVLLQAAYWDTGSFAENVIISGILQLDSNRTANGGGCIGPPVQVYALVSAGLTSNPDLTAFESATSGLPCVNVTTHKFTFMDAGDNHAKTLVVDGRVAIVTGSNIETKWQNEQGFCLEGPVAQGLQREFSSFWADDGGPPIPPVAAPLPLTSLCLQPTTTSACLPMMIIGRPPGTDPLSENNDNTQNQAYIAAFANAEHEIRIITPNLNDNDVRSGIVNAIGRGVDVRVILSRGFHDDWNYSGATLPDCQSNEECVEWLFLDSGLTVDQIREHLDIRWWMVGGRVIDGHEKGFASHGKYLSVDGQVAIFGSTNMDAQSWNASREVDVVVDDADLVNHWDDVVFDQTFNSLEPVDRIQRLDIATDHTPSAAYCNEALHVVYVKEGTKELWHAIYEYDWVGVNHYARGSLKLTSNNWILNSKSRDAAGIACDANGALHMVYIGKRSNKMYHASYQNGAWHQYRELSKPKSHMSPGLNFCNGKLHLVHVGQAKLSTDLWHSSAKWTNGKLVWGSEDDIDGHYSSDTPALACDDTGFLNMVHSGQQLNGLWHAYYGGAWSADVEIPDQTGTDRPALVFCGGKLHMVHRSSVSLEGPDIWYSKYQGGAWLDDKITNMETGTSPSLACDAQGMMHMTYTEASGRIRWSTLRIPEMLYP